MAELITPNRHIHYGKLISDNPINIKDIVGEDIAVLETDTNGEVLFAPPNAKIVKQYVDNEGLLQNPPLTKEVLERGEVVVKESIVSKSKGVWINKNNWEKVEKNEGFKIDLNSDKVEVNQTLTRSYLTLTTAPDTPIYFDKVAPDLSPSQWIQVFYGGGVLSLGSLSLEKDTLKSVVFGKDVASVSSIGDCFLSSCKKLSSIDLSSLTGVTSIGNQFLVNGMSLISIDLSSLSKVSSISNGFLYYCHSIQQVIMPNSPFLPQNVHTGSFISNSGGFIPCTIKVPPTQVDDYKAKFPSRAAYIQAY